MSQFSKYLILSSLLSILFFNACKKDLNVKNKIDFIRYDKLIFNLDTNNIKSQFIKIKNQYPEFTDIYFRKVMNFSGYDSLDHDFFILLKDFVSDTNNQKLVKMVDEEFGNMENIEVQFGEAVVNLQKEFPKTKKPKVYTFISVFAYQGFIFQDKKSDGIGIGLDMYLGKKFPYESLNNTSNTFASYLIRTYNKDHLLKKMTQIWIDDLFDNPNKKKVLDYMVDNGKKLYILKSIIPTINDTILFEYSPKQMKWLHNNEQEMWSHFIKNNFFYSDDEYKIRRLINPGPNSQALGMPLNSPGQTGNYLGYRIVEAYMNKISEGGLSTIANEQNSQNILEKSKFKPRVE